MATKKPVESKSMMKKEIDFFKKKGAPKSMVRHEQAELKASGLKRGGSTKTKKGC